MKPQKDIHDYQLRYERAKQHVSEAGISPANKTLILEFEKACTLEKLSLPRRIKLMGSLVILARDYLKKDFGKTTKEDLKNTVLKIEARDDFSVWTKHSYKSILKKFYRWRAFGDSYKTMVEQPDIIAWLRTNVSGKEKPRVKASEILTEKEIEKLIEVAEHPRDRAFISTLYELGARIGELGNLSIKDISRDKHSFILDLSGKTGHRTPRIVISDPYLAAWLNMHPLRNDPNAPLWVMLGERNKNEKMKYGAFRALVLRLKGKAKIRKRVYPHLFRHTRVTHLLINKQINETQAKVYFGWTPSSKMLSEYSHLISKDVNDTMLELHGIKTAETERQDPKIKQCPRCQDLNPKDHLFCKKCGGVLEVKTAMELDEKRGGFDGVLSELTEDEGFQKALVGALVKKGLGRKVMELLKA
ncbi:tyrosine-type recombinase/integrase [Candidatus Woesearchaeota archaeon]|nr:tyrosine-type recombinase/integrase [Candidatus Woesearchaeota archaeon]